MTTVSTFLAALLMITVAVAAVSDIRGRRIPNLLTAGACMVALALRSFAGGEAVVEGLLGTGLALLILLPLFALGGVGGGDVKLLATVGAILGPHGFLVALGITALAGGVMSGWAALRAGTLLPVLESTRELLKYCCTLGRIGRNPIVTAPLGTSVPYAVAILIGSVAALGVERWL